MIRSFLLPNAHNKVREAVEQVVALVLVDAEAGEHPGCPVYDVFPQDFVRRLPLLQFLPL